MAHGHRVVRSARHEERFVAAADEGDIADAGDVAEVPLGRRHLSISGVLKRRERP